jgi:3-methylcrotonyl-CoA carboxylase beta subunit
MGGEQAANVLAQINRDKQASQGTAWSAAEEEQFKSTLRAQYETQGNAYYASARLWDDGVIAPRDTRKIIGLSLWAASHAPPTTTKFGIFRM